MNQLVEFAKKEQPNCLMKEVTTPTAKTQITGFSEASSDRVEKTSTLTSSAIAKYMKTEEGFDTTKYTHLNKFDEISNSSVIASLRNDFPKKSKTHYYEKGSKKIKKNRDLQRENSDHEVINMKSEQVSSRIVINLTTLNSSNREPNTSLALKDTSKFTSRKDSCMTINLGEPTPEYSARIQ
jgi:hypothetical protein